ncbi:MAG: hypothetical protein ABI595_02915 [Actinomycetota bacterium]
MLATDPLSVVGIIVLVILLVGVGLAWVRDMWLEGRELLEEFRDWWGDRRDSTR